MYSIVYHNNFTKNQEVAGYRSTIRGAKFLAKSLIKDTRLCGGIRIFRGQPGGELVFELPQNN